VAAGVDGTDSPRILAHLAFCAIAIFSLEAALNFLRFGGSDSGVASGVAELPLSIARSSAILASRFVFWTSIPMIAAFTISAVSVREDMLLD
jgi:hypothetical protein